MNEDTQVDGIIMPGAGEEEVAGIIMPDAGEEEVAGIVQGLQPCL